MERPSPGEFMELCAKMQIALVTEQEAMAQERATLEAEKTAIGKLGGTEDVLELNVGGRLFVTKRSTLTQCDGLLGGMFSGRWEGSFTKDAQGRIFLDFDPDCFDVILHELRTQALIAEPVKWATVQAPPGKRRYFVALLKFLALRKPADFLPAFGPKCAGVVLDEHSTTAASHQANHRWVLGDTIMENGLHSWGFQIRSMQSWIGLGVIANASPPDCSYNHATSCMWACSSHVWQNGQMISGHGGWYGFQTGDHVTMQLDSDHGVLRMKVARLPGQTFELTNLGVKEWRVHVNMAAVNDKVELLACDEF